MIWVRRQACILKDGTLVHLARRAEIDFPKDEPNKVDPPPPVDQKFKLSHIVTLPPRSKNHVNVTVSDNGRFILEPADKMYNKYNVALATGMADVKANKPFRVRLDNFTNHLLILRKNDVLGIATRAPSKILAVDVAESSPIKKGRQGNRNPHLSPPDS